MTADVGNAKVVIKGKELKPNKILEEIRRKYSKNAQLISPKPLPETPNQTKADPPKKEEVRKTLTSFLFIYLFIYFFI